VNIQIGDIFDSDACTLVNTVNCVGVMGKGIAQEFKKRYPDMFREYVRLCAEHKLKPGQPYYYSDLTGASIINFPTKDNWRSPSKLSYIRDGLQWFRDNYARLGIVSIAFPPLGCGNGGLDWDDVGPLMFAMLSDLPIDITIFAPYGTLAGKLNAKYLASRSLVSHEVTGSSQAVMDRNWLLIPYVIQALNRGRYTLRVGRVIRQKICYVLTREGIDTGFKFVKGTYGPYSPDINAAVTALFNANLLYEQQSGDMLESIVPDDFKLDMKSYPYCDELRVERTIDLFHRIKNTDQAEMMTTVMYAYDECVKASSVVTEADVLNEVLSWKKRWNPDRVDAIKCTMSDLEMLGLIEPVVMFAVEDLL
jgi:O-acetyl-ADP-ribose deacetylase (regulator of RNase III)